MGFLQRGLLIYLCFAIAIAMSSPGVVFNGNTPADNTVLSWFNLQYDATTDTVTMADTTTSSTIADGTARFGAPTSPSSSGSVLGFVDPVYQVFSWIPLIFKVLFSPIILITSPAFAGAGTLSTGMLFIVGIPLVFMMIVGLIVWIRSGFA